MIPAKLSSFAGIEHVCTCLEVERCIKPLNEISLATIRPGVKRKFVDATRLQTRRQLA